MLSGSGKTFTMGSGYYDDPPEQQGIIPRVIERVSKSCCGIQSNCIQIFDTAAELKKTEGVEIEVKASFIELYNEVIQFIDPC